MKLYVEELVLEGCLFCPNHIRRGYSTDRDTQGRCRAVISRKNNFKLIRENEMYDKTHLENPYFKFPEWCPLENG